MNEFTINKRSDRLSIIDNTFLHDDRLSLSAKGLYSYVSAFNIKRLDTEELASVFIESNDEIVAIANELKRYDYLFTEDGGIEL